MRVLPQVPLTPHFLTLFFSRGLHFPSTPGVQTVSEEFPRTERCARYLPNSSASSKSFLVRRNLGRPEERCWSRQISRKKSDPLLCEGFLQSKILPNLKRSLHYPTFSAKQFSTLLLECLGVRTLDRRKRNSQNKEVLLGPPQAKR